MSVSISVSAASIACAPPSGGIRVVAPDGLCLAGIRAGTSADEAADGVKDPAILRQAGLVDIPVHVLKLAKHSVRMLRALASTNLIYAVCEPPDTPQVNWLVVWNVSAAQAVRAVALPGTVRSMAVNLTACLLCMSNGDLRVHDTSTLELRCTYVGECAEPGLCCSAAVAGPAAFAGTKPGSTAGYVNLLSSPNKYERQAFTIECHARPISALTMDASGRRLATASEDGRLVKLWEISGVQTARPTATLLCKFRRGSTPAAVRLLRFESPPLEALVACATSHMRQVAASPDYSGTRTSPIDLPAAHMLVALNEGKGSYHVLLAPGAPGVPVSSRTSPAAPAARAPGPAPAPKSMGSWLSGQVFSVAKGAYKSVSSVVAGEPRAVAVLRLSAGQPIVDMAISATDFPGQFQVLAVDRTGMLRVHLVRSPPRAGGTWDSTLHRTLNLDWPQSTGQPPRSRAGFERG